jgi:hypothetical protein
MYDELVKRVRQVAEEVSEDYDVDPYIAEQRFFVIEEAADAIEKLSAFTAQITDGRFYFAKDGVLFELKNDPREIRVSSPWFSEPLKEG